MSNARIIEIPATRQIRSGKNNTILTARIIEKVIVHSRQEIEIYFIGGYTQKIDLI